jgi:hypothetical protein
MDCARLRCPEPAPWGFGAAQLCSFPAWRHSHRRNRKLLMVNALHQRFADRMLEFDGLSNGRD